MVTAVDPDRRGEIIWQKRVGRGGRLGGVQWGVAADESKVYVAVSDVRLDVVAPDVPGARISPLNPTIALLLDNKVGGGLHALNLETGDEMLANAAPGLQRRSRLQPRAVGCRYSDPRHRVLRRARWPSSRLLRRRRPYRLGCGHEDWSIARSMVSRPAAVRLMGRAQLSLVARFMSARDTAFSGALPGNVLLAYSVDGR